MISSLGTITVSDFAQSLLPHGNNDSRGDDDDDDDDDDDQCFVFLQLRMYLSLRSGLFRPSLLHYETNGYRQAHA